MHLVVLIFILFNSAYSDSVCDKTTLLNEIKQDLVDNNRLDCKRVISPPHGLIETIEEKNRRLAA